MLMHREWINTQKIMQKNSLQQRDTFIVQLKFNL